MPGSSLLYVDMDFIARLRRTPGALDLMQMVLRALERLPHVRVVNFPSPVGTSEPAAPATTVAIQSQFQPVSSEWCWAPNAWSKMSDRREMPLRLQALAHDIERRNATRWLALYGSAECLVGRRGSTCDLARITNLRPRQAHAIIATKLWQNFYEPDANRNDDDLLVKEVPPRILRRIGYWIRDFLDVEFVAPQELVGPWDEQVRRRVLAYLSQGSYTSAMGYSWCRFPDCPDHTRFGPMGSEDRTDGVWSWPEGLAHYVREHDVQLPSDFVEHVLAQDGPRVALPILSMSLVDRVLWFDEDGRPQQLVEDESYWTRWCRDHGSGNVQRRIAELRDEALSAVSGTKSGTIERIEQLYDQALHDWLVLALRTA
jgi:hypothetical protein